MFFQRRTTSLWSGSGNVESQSQPVWSGDYLLFGYFRGGRGLVGGLSNVVMNHFLPCVLITVRHRRRNLPRSPDLPTSQNHALKNLGCIFSLFLTILSPKTARSLFLLHFLISHVVIQAGIRRTFHENHICESAGFVFLPFTCMGWLVLAGEWRSGNAFHPRVFQNRMAV